MAKTRARLTFVGMSSFINVGNTEESNVLGPSVVLQKTDPPDHVAFVAFHKDRVQAEPSNAFTTVAQAPGFYYLELNEVEVVLAEIRVGVPKKLRSFGSIANPIDYWPEASSYEWDLNYVGDPPSADHVKAYLRLGKGQVGASRVTAEEWVFLDKNDVPTYRDFFAYEAFFDFKAPRASVTMSLYNMRTEELQQTITFKPAPGQTTIPLWFGNSSGSYMHKLLLRQNPDPPKAGFHFAQFGKEKIVGKGISSPVPWPVVNPPSPPPPPAARAQKGKVGVTSETLKVAADSSMQITHEGESLLLGKKGDFGLCGPKNGPP